LIGISITKSLAEAVQVLSASSREIKEKIDEESQTLVQQSASVHETTAAMDQLNASFEHTGVLATEGNEKASDTLKISEEGHVLLNQMLLKLNSHKSNVTAISTQIN